MDVYNRFRYRLVMIAWIAVLAAGCSVPSQALPSPTLRVSLTPKIEFVLAENPTVTVPVLAPTDILEANQTATLPMNTPAPTTTLEAIPIDCGSLEVPRCSLQQAEALAGFEVRAPSRLPEGLAFLGAVAEPKKSSTLVYGCGEGCRLTVYQQIWEENKNWILEGNLKGEFVPIGPHRGVYAADASSAESDSTTQASDPGTANQILQWEDHINDVNFGLRISMFGSPAQKSSLGREGLIELAHDTVGRPFPTGLIAFETNRDGNVEIYAREYYDQEATNLTRHPADDSSFAWSPDGERIAFLSDRSGEAEVYVMGADGSDVRQLTGVSSVSWIGPPAWSRDGQRLALTGAAPEHGEGAGLVYLVNTDGSGYERLSKEPVFTSQPLQWSPDGKWIAFTENFMEPEDALTYLGPSSGLKAISVRGDRRNKLSGRENVNVDGFAWSPDGTQLAYAETIGGQTDLKVVNGLVDPDGSLASQGASTAICLGQVPPTHLAWSPDGTLIALACLVDDYTTSPFHWVQIDLYDVQSGTGSGISYEATRLSRISWSPEGLQILFAYDGIRPATHLITAGLLEEIPNPDRNWAILLNYDLEQSGIEANDNTNPQWQPRP